MKILKAGTYYDVFLGMGWKQHTRIQWIKRDKQFRFVSGIHLNGGVMKQAITTITKE